MSLECPRRLYYAYDSEHYANQDVNDEFLKSLAEGGFQVGEFAKLCYGIAADNIAANINYREINKIVWIKCDMNKL